LEPAGSRANGMDRGIVLHARKLYLFRIGGGLARPGHSGASFAGTNSVANALSVFSGLGNMKVPSIPYYAAVALGSVAGAVNAVAPNIESASKARPDPKSMPRLIDVKV